MDEKAVAPSSSSAVYVQRICFGAVVYRTLGGLGPEGSHGQREVLDVDRLAQSIASIGRSLQFRRQRACMVSEIGGWDRRSVPEDLILPLHFDA